jgi:hypothetical protein
MGNRSLGGESAVDRRTIGTQDGVGIQDRGQDDAEALSGGVRKHRIGGRAAAVTHDRHGDLFGGETALGRGTPAFSSRARKRSLTFVGCQKIGLVGFHDPVQMQWLGTGREGQEAMAPAKRRGLVDPAATCRSANGVAVDERLGILRPAFAVTEMGQRRPRDGIEGLAAGPAAITRQPMRLPPLSAGRVMTMRATQAAGL